MAKGAHRLAPKATTPVVQDLLVAIVEAGITDRAIMTKAGVNMGALWKLRTNRAIHLHNFIAIAQAVGWHVVLRRTATKDKDNG